MFSHDPLSHDRSTKGAVGTIDPRLAPDGAHHRPQVPAKWLSADDAGRSTLNGAKARHEKGSDPSLPPFEVSTRRPMRGSGPCTPVTWDLVQHPIEASAVGQAREPHLRAGGSRDGGRHHPAVAHRLAPDGARAGAALPGLSLALRPALTQTAGGGLVEPPEVHRLEVAADLHAVV